MEAVIQKTENSVSAYQAVFKRYELKYMLKQQQKEKVLEAMAS